MPTIRQVAKACGVSPMTVSFVLNNKPGQVSPETRERVLRAVREMDYKPHAVKQAPGPRQIITVGVVAGVAGDSLLKPGYYGSVLDGILVTADALSHNVTLFTHNLMHTDTHRSIRVYCDGRCDGLLVLAPDIDSPLIAALHERGFPLVVIGDTGDLETLSCIDIDNMREARTSVEYLISQGHRRIGFVGGPGFVRSAGQRLRAYREVMAAHGLSVDPRLGLDDLVRDEDTFARLRRMVSLPPGERATALFCWNDVVALKVLQVLREAGQRVPTDVSVIGFDDDPIARDAQPQLTTMRQPFRAIGKRAVEMLIAEIRRTTSGPQREFFPTELISRDSVGPPTS